jgi:hypothetical protein
MSIIMDSSLSASIGTGIQMLSPYFLDDLPKLPSNSKKGYVDEEGRVNKGDLVKLSILNDQANLEVLRRF